MHHVVVDTVLRIHRAIALPVEARGVRLVVAEQGGRIPVPGHPQRSDSLAPSHQLPVLQRNLRPCRLRVAPRPGITKPECRQHPKRRSLRSGVLHADLHEQVVRAVLRIVDRDNPVARFIEDSCVDELIFRVEFALCGVGLYEVVVGERRLRIVVAPRVPGMRGGGIRVPPVFLHVLAVVTLRPGEAEHPLLKNRIGAVP